MRTPLAVLVAPVAACLALVAGCDKAIEIENAAPRVTWVAVQPAVDGVAEVTVWVQDLEGDPVDLEASWQAAGGAEGALTMRPGGHGLVGLTTRDGRFEEGGQPHLLLWDVADVPPGAAIRLRFVPDDREGGVGPAVTSPAFTLEAGLPEPVLADSESPPA